MSIRYCGVNKITSKPTSKDEAFVKKHMKYVGEQDVVEADALGRDWYVIIVAVSPEGGVMGKLGNTWRGARQSIEQGLIDGVDLWEKLYKEYLENKERHRLYMIQWKKDAPKRAAKEKLKKKEKALKKKEKARKYAAKYRKEKKEKITLSEKFLIDSGVILEDDKRKGNIVVTLYWGKRRYIELPKFTTRWEGSSVWLEKKQKMFNVDTILDTPKYRGASVGYVIKKDPKYIEFLMDKTWYLFDKNCYDKTRTNLKH